MQGQTTCSTTVLESLRIGNIDGQIAILSQAQVMLEGRAAKELSLAKSKVKTAVSRTGTKPKSGAAKKPAVREAKTSKASSVKAAPAKVKPAAAKPVKAAKTVKTVTRAATTSAAKAAKPSAIAKTEKPPVPVKVTTIVPLTPVVKEVAPRQPLTLPKRAADPAESPATAIASPEPSVIKPVPRPVQGTIQGSKHQQRADIPPAAGFTLVVDGHFKNQYDDAKAATSAGTELLGKFPMLRIEIYDAAHKKRTLI